MKFRSHVIGLVILVSFSLSIIFVDRLPSGAAQARDETAPLGSIPFTRYEIITGFPQPIDVHAADIDGDGDLDILSASTTGDQIAWWENDGYQLFTPHIIAPALNYAGPVYAADLDNDGDTDVIGASISNIDGGPLAWWENDGSQNFTEHVLKADIKVSQVLGFDLDSDGDQDILVADAGAGKIVMWKNDGAGHFTEQVLMTNLYTPSDITPCDLGRDGDWDLLISERHITHASWLENDGEQHFTQRVLYIGYSTTSVAAGDLDGDGDLDLITAFTNISTDWWENNGDQTFTRHTLAAQAYVSAIALADLDGDLDLDVVLSSGMNQNLWLENDGLGRFAQYSIGPVIEPQQLQVVDLDGDLDLDVIVASKGSGTIHWWANNSPTPAPRYADLQVEIREHSFQPGTLVVAEGTRVAWTNLSTTQQTVTAGSPSVQVFLPVLVTNQAAASAALAPADLPPTGVSAEFGSDWLAAGAVYAYTFSETGVYPYYSQANPQQALGSVIVIIPDEEVSAASVSGLSVRTPSGASLEIPAAHLLGDVDGSLLSTDDPQLHASVGTPLSAAYDFQVKNFAALVSGTVTITLPYDPGQLPVEADESRVRAAFFNGRSWISVPGVVDTAANRIVVESDHLSWWEVVWPCAEPFGLSDAQEFAYDEARNYLSVLADHQDLFEALTTSTGEALFELNASGADWLARQSLCDLSGAGSSDIRQHLGIDRTPAQVASAMVSLGEGLQAQEYSSVIGAQIWEAVSTADDAIQLTINLVEVAAFGGLGGFVGDLLVDSFVDLFVSTTYNVYWDLLYMWDVSRDFDSLNTWLSSGLTTEVGQSQLNRVLAYQVETNSGLCQLPYPPSSKGFYQTWAYGNLQDAIDPSAAGFYNLYARGGEVYLVLGLQDMSPFFDTLLGIIGFERTDQVIALIEYEDGDENLRVARLVLHNSKTLPICLIGKMALPEIRQSSPVQIRYYFVDDGHLDRRFDADGVQQIVGEAQPICNGSCNDQIPNQPPYQPTQPVPVHGAIEQSTGVDLSWTGGDPNGNAVTYDIYFEANDATPDVLVAGNQSAAYHDPGSLSAST
ncbi:MAG: VCBS repeat-containing protein, partial [Anaerolineales bacterium]|nr:VCBS repeat-containing protein [Anaerolineales bacterium]